MRSYLDRLLRRLDSALARLGLVSGTSPLVHADTLAVFLWLVVGVSGVFVTLFYQFDFDGSYLAIERMEGQFVARTLRGVHRYGSGLAMIFSLIHGVRIFAAMRAAGARWLAWVTGALMIAPLWLAGVTGFWLLLDERANLISMVGVDLASRFTPWGDSFAVMLLTAKVNEQSWLAILFVFLVHLAAFAIVALLFLNHIVRLQRPRWLPPPPLMWISLGLLVLFSLVFPLGLEEPANAERHVDAVAIDPFFLFFLPAGAGRSSVALWTLVLAVGAVAASVPWWRREQKSSAEIDRDRCVGCTLCAVDCPYNAIHMERRVDDSGHALLAVVSSDMCVGCGVCVGSCDDEAIRVGDLSAEGLWSGIAAAMDSKDAQASPVTVVCSRCSDSPDTAGSLDSGRRVEVPCVGTIPPHLTARALEQGTDLRLLSCAPEECASRHGAEYALERIDRERKPFLPREVDAAAVAVVDGDGRSLRETPAPRWIAAALLLALLVGFVVAVNRLPFAPHPGDAASIKLALQNGRQPYGAWTPRSERVRRSDGGSVDAASVDRRRGRSRTGAGGGSPGLSGDRSRRR